MINDLPVEGQRSCASPRISIVVPVLDEARALPALLDHLAELPGRFEVLVVDGGSSDGTLEIARAHPLGPTVIPASRERGSQLNAAAEQASGAVLLFLHADTVLPRAAYASVVVALRDETVVGGNFRVVFDGGDGFAWLLGSIARFQRRLGVYYGDSAIFVRTEVFSKLGGFRPQSLMEDYDLARRLERMGRTVCVAAPVVTSARRWRAHGAFRTLATWIAIQTLYSLGVSPARLARFYRAVR